MGERNYHAGGLTVEIDQKLSALEKIAKVLNENRITWAVGASLLLYFKGIAEDFNDIDIIVDETDIPLIIPLLASLGVLQPQNPNRKYKTKAFLEYVVDGVEFDIMAGFVIVSGNREHAFPLKREEIVGFAAVRDTAIPLHSVAAWREYYSLMGRPEKVALIDEHRQRFPG